MYFFCEARCDKMQTSLLSFFGGKPRASANEAQVVQAETRKSIKRTRRSSSRAAADTSRAMQCPEAAAVTNSKSDDQARGTIKKQPSKHPAPTRDRAGNPFQKGHTSVMPNGGSPQQTGIRRRPRRAAAVQAATAAKHALCPEGSTDSEGENNSIDIVNSSFVSSSGDPVSSPSATSTAAAAQKQRRGTRKQKPATAHAKSVYVRHASLTGWRACVDRTMHRHRRTAPCMWDVSHVASVDVGATHEAQGVNAYTMSFLNNGAAVATGGQHGLASIAYLPRGARGGSQFAAEDGELPLCDTVVQWQAHDRWLSDMRQPDGAAALLTSSDDRTLAVWGIPPAEQCGDLWSPPLLDRQQVHSAGVYSCDSAVQGCGSGSGEFHAVSGSKDSSVHLCSVDAAGKLLPVRRWEAAHAGVVKCVRWRRDKTASVFASCGNDKAVRIWDTRLSAAALHMPESHTLSVNTVAWSPCGTFVMSSSFDNTLSVWDTRAVGKALLTAPTTTGSTSERSSSIIHPAFFMGGRVILVPLPKLSCVWTLDSLTGKPLPAGADADGKLEVVAEDLPVPPSCMAVSEDTGYASGGRSRVHYLVAANHNRRSQVWEVMNKGCC